MREEVREAGLGSRGWLKLAFGLCREGALERGGHMCHPGEAQVAAFETGGRGDPEREGSCLCQRPHDQLGQKTGAAGPPSCLCGERALGLGRTEPPLYIPPNSSPDNEATRTQDDVGARGLREQ